MKMSGLQKKYVNRPDNRLKKFSILERLLEGVDISGMRRALEVGCGPGYMCDSLSRKYGLYVVGTDVDEEELDFARSHSCIDMVSFMYADVTDLPFPDACFDLVVSMMVLHHIKDWESALSEVARVTRPGGLYLFHDITYSWLLKCGKPLLRGHAFYSIDEIRNRMEKLRMRKVYELPIHRYFFNQFTEYNVAFKKEQADLI